MFKVIDCQLVLYNNGGKGIGQNSERFKIIKDRALEDFRFAFEQFKANLSVNWHVRGSIIFGGQDDE